MLLFYFIIILFDIILYTLFFRPDEHTVVGLLTVIARPRYLPRELSHITMINAYAPPKQLEQTVVGLLTVIARPRYLPCEFSDISMINAYAPTK